MIEKVFYAVPKQMGYYDGIDDQHDENDFEEVPLDDDDDKPIRIISSNRHSNASSVRSKQSKK